MTFEMNNFLVGNYLNLLQVRVDDGFYTVKIKRITEMKEAEVDSIEFFVLF